MRRIVDNLILNFVQSYQADLFRVEISFYKALLAVDRRSFERRARSNQKSPEKIGLPDFCAKLHHRSWHCYVKYLWRTPNKLSSPSSVSSTSKISYSPSWHHHDPTRIYNEAKNSLLESYLSHVFDNNLGNTNPLYQRLSQVWANVIRREVSRVNLQRSYVSWNFQENSGALESLFQHSWFLLGLIYKSMVLSLHRRNELKSEIPPKFPRIFTENSLKIQIVRDLQRVSRKRPYYH